MLARPQRPHIPNLLRSLRSRDLLATVALSAVGLAGCPAISADVSLTDQRTTIEIDFTGECSGSGSRTSDYGTTTWVKNTVGSNCEVTASWSGNVIPTAEVKTKIDDAADGHLSDIKVKSLTVTLKGVSFTDVTGASATPPMITTFSAATEIANIPFYDVSRSQVNVFLDQAVTKSFGEDDPLLETISSALNDGSDLPATAEITLSVPVDAVEALQGSATNPHTFVFTHDFEVTAEGTASL